jgi:hypothetical protein
MRWAPSREWHFSDAAEFIAWIRTATEYQAR